VLAFIAAAGLGLGTLIGVGCAIGANTCPFSSHAPVTTLDGRTLFFANCAVCHGRDGGGTTRAPSLVTGSRADLSLEELRAKIARGKPLAGMPAFKRSLSSAQIRAVARYVVRIRSEK
jgi:cytochrome c oxidase cbb3-type subunit III